MLQTYQAQVNGSQLIWIDQPPAPLAHERVLIVVERANPVAASQPAQNDAYGIFMSSEGCLGRASRAETDAQLAGMRAEWNTREDS